MHDENCGEVNQCLYPVAFTPFREGSSKFFVDLLLKETRGSTHESHLNSYFSSEIGFIKRISQALDNVHHLPKHNKCIHHLRVSCRIFEQNLKKLHDDRHRVSRLRVVVHQSKMCLYSSRPWRTKLSRAYIRNDVRHNYQESSPTGRGPFALLTIWNDWTPRAHGGEVEKDVGAHSQTLVRNKQKEVNHSHAQVCVLYIQIKGQVSTSHKPGDLCSQGGPLRKWVGPKSVGPIKHTVEWDTRFYSHRHR